VQRDHAAAARLEGQFGETRHYSFELSLVESGIPGSLEQRNFCRLALRCFHIDIVAECENFPDAPAYRVRNFRAQILIFTT
jgi:hypothetical protein